MSRISSSHVLPPNPTYIDFPISDGDEGQWPTNTTRTVDGEGHVNYMRPVPIDESLSIKWRCEVGASLALQLKKPVGPTYVLRGWPAGYQMFDHNKGPASAPRHDAYLIGSRHARRFRSTPEFIPHALWLLTDPNLVRSNCNCKYCNKKPQREITVSMGLLPRRSSPSSATPSAPRMAIGKTQVPAASTSSASAPARQVRERAKPYAAIRRTPRPVKQAQGPKQSMLRERNADLRSAYADSIHLRKWYRDGELLWCALSSPIPGFSGDRDAIRFWPGIVEEVRMKAEAVKFSFPGETAPPAGTSEANTEQGSQTTPTENGTKSDADKGVTWTVVQTLSYKVKLLGISYSYYIPADQVLPYQAHAPSDDLIQAIHHVPLERMSTETESFHPTEMSTFDEAAGAYALAVQIAANLAGYWTPTDEWEYKFSVPPPTSPSPMPDGQRGASLDSVMNANMTFNASLANASGNNLPTFSAGSSLSAASPVALGQTVVQTRYQGLWWGAERIWTDELVRLKLSRSQIAPKGAEHILPPAGPSRKALEYTKMLGAKQGDEEAVVGAESRGVFMRVDGLHVAEITRPNGTVGKECRATGMLYELVDEDWEQESAGGSTNGNNNGKGKGKDVEVPATLESGLSGQTAEEASSTHLKAKGRSPNEQLSHPVLSSPFSLPLAPEGFKFRPILSPEHEAVLSLNLIAGRYYPRLLRHPLLDRDVEKALDVEGGHVIETSQLWALEGLAPGYYNTMDPVRWRASRVAMVREADGEAREGLEEHWRARAREKDEARVLAMTHLEAETDAMAVDG